MIAVVGDSLMGKSHAITTSTKECISETHNLTSSMLANIYWVSQKKTVSLESLRHPISLQTFFSTVRIRIIITMMMKRPIVVLSGESAKVIPRRICFMIGFLEDVRE